MQFNYLIKKILIYINFLIFNEVEKMRRNYSFSEMPKLFNNYVAPAGTLVSITTNSFAQLMETTKGKERALAFVQYTV